MFLQVNPLNPSTHHDGMIVPSPYFTVGRPWAWRSAVACLLGCLDFLALLCLARIQLPQYHRDSSYILVCCDTQSHYVLAETVKTLVLVNALWSLCDLWGNILSCCTGVLTRVIDISMVAVRGLVSTNDALTPLKYRKVRLQPDWCDSSACSDFRLVPYSMCNLYS